MDGPLARDLGGDVTLLLFTIAGLAATVAAILADIEARRAGRSSSGPAT